MIKLVSISILTIIIFICLDSCIFQEDEKKPIIILDEIFEKNWLSSVEGYGHRFLVDDTTDSRNWGAKINFNCQLSDTCWVSRRNNFYWDLDVTIWNFGEVSQRVFWYIQEANETTFSYSLHSRDASINTFHLSNDKVFAENIAGSIFIFN